MYDGFIQSQRGTGERSGVDWLLLFNKLTKLRVCFLDYYTAVCNKQTPRTGGLTGGSYIKEVLKIELLNRLDMKVVEQSS